MLGVMTAVLQPFKLLKQSLHVTSAITHATSLVKPDCFSLLSIRTKVRCYFPRPNEVRRVHRHGWKSRLSTPNGRKVIMRRLLKGKFVLTH